VQIGWLRGVGRELARSDEASACDGLPTNSWDWSRRVEGHSTVFVPCNAHPEVYQCYSLVLDCALSISR